MLCITLEVHSDLMLAEGSTCLNSCRYRFDIVSMLVWSRYHNYIDMSSISSSYRYPVDVVIDIVSISSWNDSYILVLFAWLCYSHIFTHVAEKSRAFSCLGTRWSAFAPCVSSLSEGVFSYFYNQITVNWNKMVASWDTRERGYRLVCNFAW